MKYCTNDPRKIVQKAKGRQCKQTIFFRRKSRDLLEGHSKTHHQQIIVRKKASAINDHGTEGHITASQNLRKISKLTSYQKWRQWYGRVWFPAAIFYLKWSLNWG